MRKEKTLEFLGDGIVAERVTETFTHRCDDGDIILRGDPKNHHWGAFYSNGMTSSWFGCRPKNWDESKAVEENWSREYEHEADYS